MKIELGGGFLGTLTIVFVIFKILGYINWSWWLVFLPVIIGAGIGLLILIGVIIMIIISAWFD